MSNSTLVLLQAKNSILYTGKEKSFKTMLSSIGSSVLLFLLFCFTFSIQGFGQTIYDWYDTAPDGNWKQGAGGARWTGGLWDNPPSSSATILRFNNNQYNSMTNNVGAGYIIQKIIFGSSNSSSRTIGGNSVQFYEYGSTWPRIQNDATNVVHTINFPFNASTNSGYDMELVANAGPLVFGGGITNNGRRILVYGNDNAVSGSNRYVQFTGSGVISGTGRFVVSQSGVARVLTRLKLILVIQKLTTENFGLKVRVVLQPVVLFT